MDLVTTLKEFVDGSTEIKKEIAQRQQALTNLLKAIEHGLNADVGYTPHCDELQLEIKDATSPFKLMHIIQSNRLR